jgi:hypothetical protein
MLSNNKPQPSSNLPSFAEALAASRQMQQDWLDHGVNFVDLYVEDVDGDWLEQWGENEPVENGSFSSSIESIVTFLMNNDPVAIEARPFWENRPLPEIATYLERCLTLPESDRPYAVQNLLMSKNLLESSTLRNSNRHVETIDTLELAERLLNHLLQIKQLTI